MSNSSNYSYNIILQFSLSAFVCLKKKVVAFLRTIKCREWTFIFRLQYYRTVTVYFNKCLDFFPLRRRDVTDRNITYTQWRPLSVVSGPAQPKYMYTPSTGHSPCAPTSKFNDIKSTYLRQFHTADSQVCISILFHECKYFTNCHCFPGTMCAFIAKYKPCYRPLPQNI